MHEEMLSRLSEVTSAEYPFPIPPREKIPKEKRLNVKSWKNLKPVLASLVRFYLNTTIPLLLLSSAVGLLATTGWLFKTCCVVHVLSFLRFALAPDVFFLHWLSGGRLGLLGRGAKEGIFCKDTPRNKRVSVAIRSFLRYRPTPYLYSGDLLTLWPFLFFKGSAGGRVPYLRRWIRVPAAPAPDGDGPSKRQGNDDDEAVALDLSFPAGGHRIDRPAFLILHGLNGGSTEPYVLDLVRRANAEGITAAVMINRGLMKTPLRGGESFTGARTSDAKCAVEALRHALGGKIVLVGFSMGGIVACNYVAKSGKNAGVIGAVSFSGTVCSGMLLNCSNRAMRHSMAVWQPALAWGLKATIISPSMASFLKRGLTKQMADDVTTVMEVDSQLVCKYHGYPRVEDYYKDMSAGGEGDDRGVTKLNGTKVPLLVVHAIDDPIAPFEVVMAKQIHKTDNVVLLATKHGGHIGWPRGFFPATNRWAFMIDLAMEYMAVLDNED